MEQHLSDNKRLVKNTLMLYIRTFLTMIVSLFTVRIIFNALGVTDYGIQNVISGFVAMFSFVTGSLSVAISRFMSLELVHKDNKRLSQIFSASFQSMLIAGILIVVALETFGTYFLNYHMNIAVDRMVAANWVLQFSAFTLFLNMVCVPFDALIVSYEKMSIYAYISIANSIIKLCIAYLIFISPLDRLITYGFLLFLQAALNRVYYGIYCKRHFPEIRISWHFDKKLIKQISTLAGWDLWGSSSFILKNHAVNIIINLFCGVTVNAARGIAIQVNSAIMQFSNGFLTALRPQITKAYALDDTKRLWILVNSGTKFATFLLLYISIPIILECNYILTLWLGIVPAHTVNFAILMMILSISEGSLIYAQNAALMANGNIKKCQLITGSIQLLNIPFSYLLLNLRLPVESTIIIAIIIAQITFFIRMYFLKKEMHYPIADFIKTVYTKIFFCSILMIIPGLFIISNMKESLLRLFVIIFSCFIWNSFIILFVGCNHTERLFIIHKIKTIITHNQS